MCDRAHERIKMKIENLSIASGIVKLESYCNPVEEKGEYKERFNNVNLPLKFRIEIKSQFDREHLSYYRNVGYYVEASFEFTKAFNIVSKNFVDYNLWTSYYGRDENFVLKDFRVCKGSWDIRSDATKTCCDIMKVEAFKLVNKHYNDHCATVDAADYINNAISYLENEWKLKLKEAESINNRAAAFRCL